MNKFRQISIIGWSTIGIPTVLILTMIITGIIASNRRETNKGLNVITQQDKKVEPVKLNIQPELKIKEPIKVQVQQRVETLVKEQPKKIDSFQKDRDTLRVDTQIINQIDTSNR
jgi:hypothetical protein